MHINLHLSISPLDNEFNSINFMDIKKLKELEDLIAVRKPFEITYQNKKELFKNSQLEILQASMEQRLLSENFTISSIDEGIKGTYIELIISVLKNLPDTLADKGLSVFTEIAFEGPLAKNFRVSAYELGDSGVVPDPLPPVDGQSSTDIEIQREQQLIGYYQNFNDTELNVMLGYSLTDKDTNANTRYQTLDELLNSLFVEA